MTESDVGYSRGKIWRQFAVGDPADSPLAQWTYFSAGGSGAITVEDLKAASRERQIATAFLWFGANYKPYHLSPGTYFGLDRGEIQPDTLNSAPLNTRPVSGGPLPRIAGLDQAPFAPAHVSAAIALKFEFGGIIPDSVLTELASRLPGDWTEIAAPWRLDNLGDPTGSLQDLAVGVSRGLNELTEALQHLSSAHGLSGHNSGAYDFPFTATERAELERTIERAKQILAADPTPEALASISTDIQPIPRRISGWFVEKGDLFMTEAVKSLGKEAGKVLWAALAVGVAHELMTLLAQWHVLLSR